jgi:hypothetical protein
MRTDGQMNGPDRHDQPYMRSFRTLLARNAWQVLQGLAVGVVHFVAPNC